MIIEYVYKDGDMCHAVHETIDNVKRTRGWGCDTDKHCHWCCPGATGKDRDVVMISEYKRVKNSMPDIILYEGQLPGHDSISDNDISTIWYEACMLALFMNKKWKYLNDDDFCMSYSHAKRLGVRSKGKRMNKCSGCFKTRTCRSSSGRGLTNVKLQCYPDKELVEDRKKYFAAINQKNETDNLRYSKTRVFQNELLNTLTLIFQNDFGEYI